jgi:hypothetical protein
MLASPRRRIGRLSYGFQLVLVVFAYMALSAPRVSAQSDADERAWAHSSPNDLVIKLVTFGPGDQIFNYFGHNGMIVEDRAQHVARLYNFGMFHFGLSMLPNYMKGKLTFWVAATPVRATFAHYRENNRSIRVQELNLLPEKRKAMADALDLAAAPANRDYLYDHFFNNCSTRLRDLVDDATGGQFKQRLDHPARMSYRQHIRRFAQKDPITDFALVFWMNDFMERPIKQWDELFLPEELELQVARMHYRNAAGQDVPLVAAPYEVFTADRPAAPEFPNRGYPWALALGALIGALAWVNGVWVARARSAWPQRLLGLQHTLFGFVLGIPGLAAALMWAFTEHTVTYRNENLLLSNPITFALFPFGLAIAFGSARALRLARVSCYALAASSLALLLLKLLPSFNQDTSLPMALLLPANLGYALAHRAIAQRASSPARSVEPRGSAVSRA